MLTAVGTVLAETIMEQVQASFRAAADPEQAAGMRSYMRDRFDFLGIPAPTRRALARPVLAGFPRPTEPDLRAVAEACWSQPQREFQYFACDLLVRHAARLSADFVEVAGRLITTRSWWDTVDPLATRVVAVMVGRHPDLLAVMDAWSAAPNVWLVRTAILHQLHYGTDTDIDRLFGYCERQAGHDDFFVRKAIGWALRQYARTDPDAVRRFVDAHRHRLAPLSVREATRHLG